MKVSIICPKKYTGRKNELEKLLYSLKSPFLFVNKFYKLRALSSINIEHKPIKYRADYKTPHTMYMDFRNNVYYLALSIAHEYAHLLFRKNNFFNKIKLRAYLINDHDAYSFDQALAILTQVSYEDSVGIRKFTRKTIFDLMRYMDVNPIISRALFKSWDKKRFNKQIISAAFLRGISEELE